jgi:hypothetical protein
MAFVWRLEASLGQMAYEVFTSNLLAALCLGNEHLAQATHLPPTDCR